MVVNCAGKFTSMVGGFPKIQPKLTLSQKRKNMQMSKNCIFFRFWESVNFGELQKKLISDDDMAYQLLRVKHALDELE